MRLAWDKKTIILYIDTYTQSVSVLSMLPETFFCLMMSTSKSHSDTYFRIIQITVLSVFVILSLDYLPPNTHTVFMDTHGDMLEIDDILSIEKIQRIGIGGI